MHRLHAHFGSLALAALSAIASPPVGAASLTGVTQIAAGGLPVDSTSGFTCVLTSAGSVKCWGANWGAQVGIAAGTAMQHSPVEVAGLGGIATSIGVASDQGGPGHTCALLASGEMRCWGYNFYGSLGVGSSVYNTPTPVTPTGFESGVSAIIIGGASSCAVVNGGNGLKCFGLLATPAGGFHFTPLDIPNLGSGVVRGSQRGGTTCFVTPTQGLRCWGRNDYGEAGAPPGMLYPPADVPGLTSGVAAVATGAGHTCVLTIAGGVKCWGLNSRGQLGYAAAGPSQPIPTDVPGLTSGVLEIAGGGEHTCALTASRGVKCWGRNTSGQLGDGTNADRASPVDVVGLGSGVATIGAGGAHTCAAMQGSGALVCWGGNSAGELGDGTTTSRNVPGPVLAALPASPTAPQLVGASDTGRLDDDRVTRETRPTLHGSCSTGSSVVITVGLPTAVEVQSTPCIGGAYDVTLTAALAEGPRQIRATGRSADGDSPPSNPLDLWIDLTAPTVVLTASPPAVSADSRAQFSFTASDAVAPFPDDWIVECVLDAASTSCTSPRRLSGLSVGNHTFTVRATDRAGNAGEASFTWSVAADTVPEPFAFTPAVNAVPGATITSNSVTITGINAPAAVSVSGGTYAIGCTESFTTATGTVAEGQTLCVRHAAGAAYATTTTTLTVGGVSAAFSSTASELIVAPAAIDFARELVTQPSPPRSVTITNQTSGSVSITSITTAAPYSVTHDCTALAAGATCTASVTFTPSAEGVVSGNLAIATAGGTRNVPLVGPGVRSLVPHYYRSILRREPDTAGDAYWQAEADRVRNLGLDANEAWFAMAATFFESQEYRSLNRDRTGFVTDLYRTFFNRAPDAEGLAFWTGQLAAGLPREVALTSFMFSTEFANFTQAIFGNTPVRAEVNLVSDFYRGFLARPPDNPGFNHWVGRFRAAQCQGPAAVTAIAESISSAFALSNEYRFRNRQVPQYVGDLYNAFLRRGGDLPGVMDWIGRIPLTQTHEQVRQEFVASVEFQARVAAVIAQGCLTP